MVSEVLEGLAILAAVGGSILTWSQTNRQIKLSNKQALFEKRLEVYIRYEKLLNKAQQLKEKCVAIVEKNSQPYYENLTWNAVVAILMQVDEFVPDPWTDGDVIPDKIFYSVVENIEMNGKAVELLWPDIDTDVAREFHSQYRKVLTGCHRPNNHYLLGVEYSRALFETIEKSERLLELLNESMKL